VQSVDSLFTSEHAKVGLAGERVSSATHFRARNENRNVFFSAQKPDAPATKMKTWIALLIQKQEKIKWKPRKPINVRTQSVRA
jgi:hypothetical protein